jgi:transcriptional regulator with XRE-family HTH domain
VASKLFSGPGPNRGCIRVTRQRLGLTLNTIAKRLGIQRQNVLQFEISEERDQIKLASLRRVADAMDCDLVYSIVPRRTAGLTVRVVGAKGTNRQKKQTQSRKQDQQHRRSQQ